MKIFTWAMAICGLVLGAALLPPLRAAEEVGLGGTAEVIKALKSHYVDHDVLDEKLVNEATVEGILRTLGAGATFLSPGQSETNTAPVTVAVNGHLARAEVIDPAIGYIRVADVVAETVPAIDAELAKFASAKVNGYILDLRYADGSDFAAAATVASRFLNDGQVLFTLKKSDAAPQVFRATAVQNPPTPKNAALDSAPLMVLINPQTRGSAEVLAGALRAQNRAILIGNNSAGQAVAWDDVKLGDGRVLRVAKAKIVLPATDGLSPEIFPTGVKPDIAVRMIAKLEGDVIFNAPTNLTLTAALQPKLTRRGLSEAELVKAFHGESVDAKPGAESEVEADAPKVRDAVLQRAVDILKGIRVLLSWQ